jgi:hypothetical protein
MLAWWALIDQNRSLRGMEPSIRDAAEPRAVSQAHGCPRPGSPSPRPRSSRRLVAGSEHTQELWLCTEPKFCSAVGSSLSSACCTERLSKLFSMVPRIILGSFVRVPFLLAFPPSTGAAKSAPASALAVAGSRQGVVGEPLVRNPWLGMWPSLFDFKSRSHFL